MPHIPAPRVRSKRFGYRWNQQKHRYTITMTRTQYLNDMLVFILLGFTTGLMVIKLYYLFTWNTHMQSINVKIDFNDLDSIKKAERQKTLLENKGYTLIQTITHRNDCATLRYKK